MSNLGVMRDRIASELGDRTDLNTQIVAAIQSAIKFYENEHFWFNEEEAESTTVIGTASYTLPSNFIEMFTISIDYSTSRNADPEPLNQIPIGQMRNLELTSDGQPSKYAIYREELKLHPTPDAEYPMTMLYLRTCAEVSGTSDTNEWMVEGEELIRLHAKQDVRVNVLNLDENAVWTRRENVVFNRLKGRTRQMVATGKLQPTNI